VAVVTRTARTPLALAGFALVACVLALLLASGATSAGKARAQDVGVPGTGCVAEFGGGDSWLRLNVRGRTRDVLLHVPQSVDAGQAAPLLIAVHGWASGAAEFAAVTRFSTGGDERGIVVAYPQGLGQPAGWHFAGIPSSDRGGRPADLGLFDALLERLTASGCVDPRKVYVAGHSQGGGMATELGCRRTDVLAGVALISGEHFHLPCQPSRPIPILSLHAVDDEVLPYAGGHVTGMPAGYPAVLPAEVIARTWATYNHCDAAPTSGPTASGATEFRWLRCLAPVVFDRLPVGGHAWAGGGAGAFSASDAVWSFVGR
jgi:polyhydroxybutyrate depolymerase